MIEHVNNSVVIINNISKFIKIIFNNVKKFNSCDCIKLILTCLIRIVRILSKKHIIFRNLKSMPISLETMAFFRFLKCYKAILSFANCLLYFSIFLNVERVKEHWKEWPYLNRNLYLRSPTPSPEWEITTKHSQCVQAANI